MYEPPSDKGFYLLLIDVKAGDPEFLFAEQENQWQADIPQPNHSQPGRTIS